MSDGISPKMKRFLDLVRVLREKRDGDYTALEDEREAFAEIEHWLRMVEWSIGDGDSVEVRLENAAGLFGAALALGAMFLQFVSEEQIEAVVATQRENEVEP